MADPILTCLVVFRTLSNRIVKRRIVPRKRRSSDGFTLAERWKSGVAPRNSSLAAGQSLHLLLTSCRLGRPLASCRVCCGTCLLVRAVSCLQSLPIRTWLLLGGWPIWSAAPLGDRAPRLATRGAEAVRWSPSFTNARCRLCGPRGSKHFHGTCTQTHALARTFSAF